MRKIKKIMYYDQYFYAYKEEWEEIEFYLSNVLDLFIKEGYEIIVSKPEITPLWRFSPIWFKLRKGTDELTIGLYLDKKSQELIGTFVNPLKSIFIEYFPDKNRSLEEFDNLPSPFQLLFSKRLAFAGLNL